MEEWSGMGNDTEPGEPDGEEDELTYESEKTAKMIMIGLYAIIFLFSLGLATPSSFILSAPVRVFARISSTGSLSTQLWLISLM